MVAYTRTTGTGRFSPGRSDATMVHPSGTIAGMPPVVFMTGGGLTPAANPSAVGFDRLLEVFTDARLAVVQPDVAWDLGSTIPPHDSHSAIDDAIAWHRANLQGTMDPPFLFGFSNGWICACTYMRDHPVTGVIGGLTPVANQYAYEEAYRLSQLPGGTQNTVTLFEQAYDITWPEPVPQEFDPYSDIANYDPAVLRGKVLAYMSSSDYIFAPQQQAFFTRMGFEFHNIGPIGHTGTWSSIWAGATGPADQIDAVRLLEFINERLDAL